MALESSTVASLQAPRSADSVAVVGDSVTTDHSIENQATISQSAVIGTYALEKSQSSSSRKGSALLVTASRTVASTEAGEKTTYTLCKRSELPLPGVLDVCSHSRKIYAACARNALVSMEMSSDRQSLTSTFLQSEDSSTILALSLDVTTDANDRHYVAASHSTGDVSVYQLSNSTVELLERRKTHDLEAWSVCQRENVLYSGGDDGVLAAWSPNTPGHVFRLRAPHEGVGITSVAMSPGSEFELWSGGYDDTLRVWDTRMMKTSVAKRHVGGGLWRIKFHPCGLVLLATMYDGFKVVRKEGLSLVARYDEHKSIAYGATWLPALDSANSIVALTASFYDCAVRLWTLDRDDAEVQ